jgi:hypothetical protein
MKKSLAAAVVLVGVAIGITGCQKTTVSGPTFRVETGKPFVDFQDLKSRRDLLSEGYSMLGYQQESDGTISLRFFTHGKAEDKDLIDPTIERLKYLTQNLSKEHAIHAVFVDGNPMMTVNDKPVGTGDVIREVTLPITQ